MSPPVVLYITTPFKDLLPTYKMGWSGSGRLSYWHLQSLARCGLDLHVVAPRNSKLDLPDTNVALSRTFGLLDVDIADRDEARQKWREDVTQAILKLTPDVVLFQAPAVDVLEALPEALLDRIVFCSHYGFKTQLARRDWLINHPQVLITAVSELHRSTMGSLTERATTTRAGIPVDSYSFHPKMHPPSDAELSVVARAFHQSGGKLLSQIDRLSQDKSQVSAVAAFLDSALPQRGWHLVIGGNAFLGPNPPTDEADKVKYHAELMHLVEARGKGSVHLLGPLSGHQVQQVYAASACVLAPYGLDLPDYHEAFGLAPAISQSIGTPVLGTRSLDASIIEDGVSGWWIDSDVLLSQQLNELDTRIAALDRTTVRRWAENHQSLRQMFISYGEIIRRYAERAGKQWSLSADTLETGLAAATTAAIPPESFSVTALDERTENAGSV